MNSDLSVRDKVRAEYHRFVEALPGLLEQIPGKWVVFLNNEVVDTFESEQEALERAVEMFGVRGGFVVAHVEPVEVGYATAGMMYAAP